MLLRQPLSQWNMASLEHITAPSESFTFLDKHSLKANQSFAWLSLLVIRHISKLFWQCTFSLKYSLKIVSSQQVASPFVFPQGAFYKTTLKISFCFGTACLASKPSWQEIITYIAKILCSLKLYLYLDVQREIKY